MSHLAPDGPMREALNEWAQAWVDGNDPGPETLRPQWNAALKDELARRIENRKAPFARCVDSNDPEATPPFWGQRGQESFPDIPNYRFIRTLGEGGQGVVFEAVETTVLERHVVVKVLKRDSAANQECRERFRREALALKDLNHVDNIVKILAGDFYRDRLFLVLEYCAGGSLYNRIRDGATLPPTEAASLVLKLARAIAAAHDLGRIHRDLKPDNIVLAMDGTPKIADFGLGKGPNDSNLTAPGDVNGTPGYWAPEQAFGQETGTYTDIYGLGAILYRVLVGVPPVKPRRHALADDQVRGVFESIKWPREIDRTVPRDLAIVCMKCLEFAPGNRYRSARELADDLQRFLNGEPVEARSLQLHSRVFGTLTRSRLDSAFHDWDRLALLAAVFLSALGVWSVAFYESGRPDIAFNWLGGTGLFWAGMIGLLTLCVRKNFERGRQFGICIGLNLVGCSLMQFISQDMFGSVGQTEINIWSGSAVINATALGFVGLFLDWRFLLAGGMTYFSVWAVILSRLPYQWSCFWYDQAWALFLVGLCFYLRTLGHGPLHANKGSSQSNAPGKH
jgi:serine/threonine protein kinase